MLIPKQKKMEMLRSLLLSRRFEEELTQLCKIERKIPGMMILCTEQEAVGSGPNLNANQPRWWRRIHR